MRVSLATLGCKANQADTAAIGEMFARHGHTLVPFPAPADVYIINTCAVTGEAVRKSRQLARRAHRLTPGAPVILTGCYAQTGSAEAASLPGVAMVVGPQDRGRLVDLVEAATPAGRPRLVVRHPGAEPGFIDLPAAAVGEHTRVWLKIQDGCQQFCSYCLIPMARGPYRSLPPPRVYEEARQLAAKGYREIVLTGIHLGAYGLDLPYRPDLAGLIGGFGTLPDLVRLRLGSIEPNDVSPALIDALAASPVFCRHLHLPLQSGDDTILSRMRRPYRRADYAALLYALRRSLPGLAVSTDLMVGFPGETDEQFAASLSFVQACGFSRLHVFPYSPRPGTAAASFPGRLPRPVRESRSREAVALGEESARRFNESLLGKELSVLVEEWRDGVCRGLAAQYVEVSFASESDLRGRIVPVTATEADAASLRANRSEPPPDPA